LAAAAVGLRAGGPPTWVLPIGVAAGYLILAQGLSVLTAGQYSSPTFWPAAGVALGALLITPRTRWPAIVLAVFLAEMTSNIIFQANAMAMLGWSLANVLNPLIAATLIRRAHPRFDLGSPAQLAAFVAFAGVLGPLVSGLVGTATSVIWWGSEWSTLGGWWVGDALGGLVIAPLFVAFRAPRLRRSTAEIVISGGLLVGAVVAVFQNWDSGIDIALTYLVLPPLVWTALRFGLRGAAIGAALLGMVGGWSTPIGYGPFTATADFNANVLFQLYLGVMTVASLLIAVLVADLTERDVIQRESERRQRQQAALAQLGQHSLLASYPEEVLRRLDDALRAIAERSEERPDRSRSPAAADDPGLNPWEPLDAHRELLVAQRFVDRHPIEPDAVALAASASTIAANALDRLEQEERLRDRAEELESLNTQLARAITFREELVSMVGHELRSPLTPIIGFTDVLRRAALAEEADARVALDAIERNARRILALIDELLLSARVADGELAAHPVPTDVLGTLRRTLQHGFDHVEVVIDTDTESDTESAIGPDIGPDTEAEGTILALVDPGHLSQCVLNLVTNAAKYGEPPVVVRVRADGPDHVVIEVSDQGEGVPAEMVPVLFERFTQVSIANTDASRGVGLGLSIVRSFAEANHGSVSYRPPRGRQPTAFVLRFPRGQRHGAPDPDLSFPGSAQDRSRPIGT
jgi:signal transduction histidine kinase